MIVEAIKQAEERLARAKVALAVLNTGGEPDSRESAWIDLITALGTVYSKLEQGAKQSGESAAWYGRMKNERKSDPLLSYVHHARNSAEHGISPTGRLAKQAVSFVGIMKIGTEAGIRLTPDGPKPFSTDPDLDLQFVENDVHLHIVRDRGIIYHPPMEHLGKPLLEFGARCIGALAVEYVERMIDVARTMNP